MKLKKFVQTAVLSITAGFSGLYAGQKETYAVLWNDGTVTSRKSTACIIYLPKVNCECINRLVIAPYDQQNQQYPVAILMDEDDFIKVTKQRGSDLVQLQTKFIHGDYVSLLKYMDKRFEIYQNGIEQITQLLQDPNFRAQVLDKVTINPQEESDQKIFLRKDLPVEIYVDLKANPITIFFAHELEDSLRGFPLMVTRQESDEITIEPYPIERVPGGADIRNGQKTVFLQGWSYYTWLLLFERYHLFLPLLKYLKNPKYSQISRRCFNMFIPQILDNNRGNNDAPVNLAVSNNSPECLFLLLQVGVDPNGSLKIYHPPVWQIFNAHALNRSYHQYRASCVGFTVDNLDFQRRNLQYLCNDTRTNLQCLKPQNERDTLLNECIRQGRVDLFLVLAFDYLRKKSLPNFDTSNNHVDLSQQSIRNLIVNLGIDFANQATKQNWTSEEIFQDTARKTIYNVLLFLQQNKSASEIMIELQKMYRPLVVEAKQRLDQAPDKLKNLQKQSKQIKQSEAFQHLQNEQNAEIQELENLINQKQNRLRTLQTEVKQPQLSEQQYNEKLKEMQQIQSEIHEIKTRISEIKADLRKILLLDQIQSNSVDHYYLEFEKWHQEIIGLNKVYARSYLVEHPNCSEEEFKNTFDKHVADFWPVYEVVDSIWREHLEMRMLYRDVHSPVGAPLETEAFFNKISETNFPRSISSIVVSTTAAAAVGAFVFFMRKK